MAQKKNFKSPIPVIKRSLVKAYQIVRKPMNRANAAHVMMILFVSLNAVGAWIIAPQYGFITAGICSGIYGFLLGRD